MKKKEVTVKKNEQLFIGADCGGTKIAITVINSKKKAVCCEKLGLSGNIASMGGEKVAFEIIEFIRKKEIEKNIAGFAAALAGYSNLDELMKFNCAIASNLTGLNADNYSVMPDYEIFFKYRWNDFNITKNAADTPEIVLIAGTGSLIIGRMLNNNGGIDTRRVFGRGALISDPGSSFDLGLRFIRRFLIEHDLKKADPGIYTVIEKAGYADVHSLISKIDQGSLNFRKNIAALAPIMTAAAELMPDSAYNEELTQACSNLISGVASVINEFKKEKKIGFSDANILLNGSLVLNSKYYKKILIDGVNKQLKGVNVNFFDAPEDVSPICADFSLFKYGENLL